jgi:hypothetical protein
MAVLYCGVIGVLRTLSEGHAIYQLLTHPDMTAAEAFSSAICSHLMTPAINAALAILQVCSISLPAACLNWVSMEFAEESKAGSRWPLVCLRQLVSADVPMGTCTGVPMNGPNGPNDSL